MSWFIGHPHKSYHTSQRLGRHKNNLKIVFSKSSIKLLPGCYYPGLIRINKNIFTKLYKIKYHQNYFLQIITIFSSQIISCIFSFFKTEITKATC